MMLRGDPPSDSSGVADDRSISLRFASGQDEALLHVQGWVEGVVQDALVRLLGAVARIGLAQDDSRDCHGDLTCSQLGICRYQHDPHHGTVGLRPTFRYRRASPMMAKL
jgi:hypothetical protein